MTAWMQLCKFPPREAVQHIRLTCVPALQRAVDTRYTDAQWSALTPEEALDALGKLVLRSSNQATLWADFFGSSQGQDEPISEFFRRCAQKAADCAFQCPECQCDLAEYVLLRKLVVGLSDEELKRHVFQTCESYTSVDALRAVCFRGGPPRCGG